MEEIQIPKVKYALSINFFDNKAVIKSDWRDIEFDISKEEFENMVYYGYLPEPLMRGNTAIYLFDDPDDYAEMYETVALLFAFKEQIKDWKEFKKYADVIVRLHAVQLLFWYSRVREYRNQVDKVIKAFKELYL